MKWLGLIGFALCTLLLGLYASTTNRTAAQTTASAAPLKVAGLRERVTVRRDERGIPYIEAANDHDLYFAQGFVTASDRLWQMDVLRRSARGELAEIFGQVVLEEDKRRRTYGFARQSEQVAAKLGAESRALVEAYASGVNAYITACDEKTLPVEFRILQYTPRPWTPADSIVLGYLMHESLTNSWRTDVMRAAFADLPAERFRELFPEFTPLDTPVVGRDKVETRPNAARKVAHNVRVSPELLALANQDELLKQRSMARMGLDADALAASNNWVVSGKQTAAGKPLLANDPHLALSVPPIWYLVHLSAPGVRVAGVTIPGIHTVIIGHNERIAWGFTNIGPDAQDLYREKFDAANPRRYATPAGWKDAEVRTEEIKVRKAPTSPATETVAHEVTVTRHGPIVLERNGERYALRWTVFDTSLDPVQSFHRLNRARNWREFCAAISTYTGAPQNHVYADVDGHIGYYGARYIPIRKSGDGSVPYDGATDEGEWTGYIPFEQLPHVFDPPAGYIATANARIVGRDYPHFITHAWAQPYRQKRINELLKQNKKFTIDDFRTILGDDYAIGGKLFVDAVLKLFNSGQSAASAADGGSSTLPATLSVLAAWDGRVLPDSRGALLVNEWRQLFANRVLRGVLGEERAGQYRWGNRDSFIDFLLTEWPQHWLPKEFSSWQALLIACESEARANLTRQLGSDESKWVFGSVVQVRFNHPLADVPLVGNQFKIDPFPQRGTGAGGGVGPTVNVGPTVSMRLIADTSNWDNTQHGISVGQSGNPASPHYKDQVNDWRNVTPRVFPFSKAAVEKAANKVQSLVP
jgi:penicillin G amidase